jgi:hypothetical protein
MVGVRRRSYLLPADAMEEKKTNPERSQFWARKVFGLIVRSPSTCPLSTHSPHWKTTLRARAALVNSDESCRSTAVGTCPLPS